MLRRRQLLHPPPSARAYSAAVAAAELKSLLQGPIPTRHLLQIHGRVFRVGAHQDDLIATRLIGHNAGIFPFNAAIRVLADSGSSAAAFSVFRTLKRRSISPNAFTFSFLLKACFFQSSHGLETRQVHAQIFKHGLEEDPPLCNGLLSAYAKGADDLSNAQKLFEGMPERRIAVSVWSCLIRGLAQGDRPVEALSLFLRMREERLSPEDDTMVAVLSACSKIQDIEIWIELLLSSRRPADADDPIDIILIYLCGKLGEIERSRVIFDAVVQRSGRRTRMSIILWNCMISACAQNSRPAQAVDLFHRLVSSPDHPKANHVTMASILPAIAEIGDLELGRWAHRFMEADSRRQGVLRSNSILATAFVDMFCKCGSPEEARKIFGGIASKDAICFNAMMALQLFAEMREMGVRPNGSSFVALLSACNHAGWPEAEHYACYVDLLARSGRIEDAAAVVEAAAAAEQNEQVLGAILSGCLVHGRVEQAMEGGRKLVEEGPEIAAGYVMLSNACAAGGRWEEVAGVRGLMVQRGLRKEPACSWITLGGVTREFHVGCLDWMEFHIVQEIWKACELV
ncbi:unnamed protein product [Spirodela intermedia]|uniref:Uncharacterized protein n=1 Tax=Spirodela intermedia TaxID=51605 RepID=A0A7I8IQN9_SPIIN|nr:unnamed protein product [Spirodela intermedia]CAA6659320.1 unnamed protein product [Spirodela intermedia]